MRATNAATQKAISSSPAASRNIQPTPTRAVCSAEISGPKIAPNDPPTAINCCEISGPKIAPNDPPTAIAGNSRLLSVTSNRSAMKAQNSDTTNRLNTE